MCGLFGMMGSGIIQKDLSIISQLGMISQLRGTDGTGVFEINSREAKQKGRIFKVPDAYSYFEWYNDIKNAKKDQVLNNIFCDFIMGHVRSATSGDHKVEHTHPFTYTNLVGCHNGTLKSPKFIKEGEVDSDLLFNEISNNGVIKVLEELSQDCAYAISLYDRISKSFVFARNLRRPLAFAINKKRNVIYWASEIDALRYMESRNGEDWELITANPGMFITSTKRIDDFYRKKCELFEFKEVDDAFVKKLKLDKEEKERKEKELQRRLSNFSSHSIYDDDYYYKAWRPEIPVVNENPLKLVFDPEFHNKHDIGVESCKDCSRPILPSQQYDCINGSWGHYDKVSSEYYCEDCTALSVKAAMN